MATKKFSPAQIAAQKLFAERARAGTLGKGKRKPNPGLYDNINAKRNPRKNTMKTFNFSANGVDFGDYKASTLTEAKTKFAHDAGYKSWSYMVSEAEESGGNNIEIVELTGGGGFVRRNPDKSKPRAYVKRASQATGAPPSKRLVTRRKMALKAPAGYFPNPEPSHGFARIGKPFAFDDRTWKVLQYSHNGKTIEAYTTDRKKFIRREFDVSELMIGRRKTNPAATMMTGYQVICMHPKKHVVGIFKTMAEAKLVARAMADAKNVPYAVKTVKVHKAHFAV